MKKYLKYMDFAMMVVLCVVMVSCSKKDDDDDNNNNNSLSSPSSNTSNISPVVGNWTRTYQNYGRVTENLNLKADGTYTEEAWLNSEKTFDDYGVYSYNEITTVLSTVSKAGERPWTYFVANVSDDVLVLVFSDYSGTITYTKK